MAWRQYLANKRPYKVSAERVCLTFAFGRNGNTVYVKEGSILPISLNIFVSLDRYTACLGGIKRMVEAAFLGEPAFGAEEVSAPIFLIRNV